MNHPLFKKHETILSEIGETYVKITNMADRHFQVTRETALDFAAWWLGLFRFNFSYLTGFLVGNFNVVYFIFPVINPYEIYL